MFSHVMIGANDLEASRKFYDAVLGTLNLSPGVANNDNRYFYRSPKGSLDVWCSPISTASSICKRIWIRGFTLWGSQVRNLHRPPSKKILYRLIT